MRYDLYQDSSQWLTMNWWYWKPSGAPEAKGHGPFPFRWMAALAARIST